jgi:hypothetical protein
MTGYSIVLLSLSAAGVVLLVGLIVQETLADLRSEKMFAALSEASANFDDDMAWRAIRLAQEWVMNAPERVRVTAEGQELRESGGPRTGERIARERAEQEKKRQALDENAQVVSLLASTFLPSDEQEFPVRAFARHDRKDRSRISTVLLLLRADREIRKARRS